MRLLVAELAKLVRPVTFGVAGAAAVFCVLLAAGGAHNAEVNTQGAPAHVPSCADLQAAPGPSCARAQARVRARLRHLATVAGAPLSPKSSQFFTASATV